MAQDSKGYTLLGINHLGLAAKDPEKCRWFFRDVLGLPSLGEELVADQGVNTVMFRTTSGSQSLTPRLELLIPSTPGEGPVAKYLEKKGGGIHHLAIGVDQVDAVIKHLKESGVRLIDEKARKGAHRTRVAFVHPESTGGFLVEFVEEER